jgi:SPOR domain
MIRRSFLIIIILGFSTLIVCSQTIISSSDLFKKKTDDPKAGQLNIIQDPALDTLMSRYIIANEIQEQKNGSGIEGFRIQIYNSSNRNAREESAKVRADFMNQFPDINSYLIFAEPGYYKVRVGNFRSRTEATRLYLIISKKFPNADLVPDIISLPDLNNK